MLGVLVACSGASSARPAAGAISSAPFQFNWRGKPAVPTPWVPAAVNDWDLEVNSRDDHAGFENTPAAHGPDCSPYPNTHTISTFEQAAYICNEHLMTAINAPGYGEVVLTPARMLDFGREGTVEVSTTSMRPNDRDLLGFQLTPFADNLVYPVDPGNANFSAAGGNGQPRNGIELIETGIPSHFDVNVYRDFAITTYPSLKLGGHSVEDCVRAEGVSESRRDPYRIVFSPGHLRMTVTVGGIPCTLLDQDIVDPGFTRGVLQIAHHNYTPFKAYGSNCAGSCQLGTPTTWHWSDFSISSPVPFTMLRGDQPATGAGPERATVHFGRPAPPGSFLRFAGYARRDSVRLRLSGGSTISAVAQAQSGSKADGRLDDVKDINYWTPIPAGTTSVTFQAASNYTGRPWRMQDVSIWSQAT